MRLSLTVSAGVLLFSYSAICADTGAGVAILQEKCLACHGESSAMSGLVLTTRENLLKGGLRGPAIVPGRPEKSVLVDALRHDGELQMPPGPKLPQKEIRILTDWIRRGAVWGAKGIQ